jgi:pyrroline-5-carboxylate reductase
LKISIIGGGKMGEAIISGLLKSGEIASKDIIVAEVLEKRREYITETYDVICTKNIRDVIKFCDIIILAVKPKDMREVIEKLNKSMASRKILVSIAAGIPLKHIQEHLKIKVPIIRAMPNLACAVGEAMIVICPSKDVNKQDLKMTTELFNLLGEVIQLDETYLNLATGLVGSGPAYIFLIIDALADAGVRLGLPKETSILLAAQTTLGAARMVVETKEHPVKLKDKVATPAGTTVEGLLELEKGNIRAVIISAISKASKKAEGLAS